MSLNDENMQDLTTELQKFRATFADIMKDTKKSHVTLDNIAQTLKETQNITQQAADDQVTAPDVEGLDDDMRKALEAHNRAVEGAKQTQEEEEQAEVDREKRRSESEAIDLQKKNTQSQIKTNEYLQALTDLTEKNNQTIQEQKDARRNPLSVLGSAYGSVESSFYRASDFGQRFADPTAGGGASKITGGIGETLTGFRKMGSALKKPFEYLKGRGSRKRQKEIEQLTKEINKEKAVLSAEYDTLNMGDRSKSSGKRDAFRKQLSAMRERRDVIKGKGKQFGDVVSDEYMYQKGRSDKNFRNMSEYERNLLTGQTSRNITKSVTSDIGGGRVTDVGSRLRNKSDDSMRTGMIGKAKSTLGGIPKAKPSTTKSRTKQKKEAAVDFDVPLKTSTTPRTYGEYIAGIYSEMDALNKTLDKTLDKNAKKASSMGGDDEDGSGFLGGLIGGLGSFLLGGLGKLVFKGLKGVGKLGAKGIGKFGSETGIKFLEKFGSKAAVDGGTKALAKTGGKGLAKFGGKSMGKGLAKGGGKMLAKKIPFLGLAAALGFAVDRFSDGDVVGGLGEILSGGLSIFPGVGTAASFGVDALLAGRDIAKENEAASASADNKFAKPKTSGRGMSRKRELERRQKQQSLDSSYSENLSGRPMKVSTTMGTVGEASSHQRAADMQIQARLIALEMKKVYKDPEYVETQKSMAMVQGKAVSQATFG